MVDEQTRREAEAVEQQQATAHKAARLRLLGAEKARIENTEEVR
jgi:hypothetical protein